MRGWLALFLAMVAIAVAAASFENRRAPTPADQWQAAEARCHAWGGTIAHVTLDRNGEYHRWLCIRGYRPAGE